MPCLRTGVFAALLGVTSAVSAGEPRVLDDRLKLELFAEQPQIVTPTGIDVDHRGRVWALESHTHFPPEGYQGHPTDRVLVMEDTNADGRADKITVFADGLRHAMSVAVKPVWLDEPAAGRPGGRQPPGQSTQTTDPGADASRLALFVATRRDILLLRDTDGDLKVDERQTLVHLDTKGDYPHNGLAGFAFDALGWMFFGFGENLGESYKIIGSDGVTLSGGGEGGNLYRCRPDGTKLEQWATGFWNPHASCFDAFGRLFTVDNDPDSRPPCRLLHIIPGGDYGYRFRNGRKGTHPFTSWNGEIPGTLPMVSGTGEAPSGIICYESDGFPEDYLGTLLVGSWGDHRIDKFVLEPKGASFVSRPQPIVQGDENFRPVGLALAPDGSVYFTDWVLKDYKLHGKGRVWRLSNRTRAPSGERPSEIAALSIANRRLAARRLAQTPVGQRELLEFTLAAKKSPTDRTRFEGYWALLDASQNAATAQSILSQLRHVPRGRVGSGDLLYRQHFWWAHDPTFREPPERLAIAHAVADAEPTETHDDAARLAALIAHGRVLRADGPVWNELPMAKNLDDPFLFLLQVRQYSRVVDSQSYRAWWDNEQPPTDTGRLILTLAQRLRDPRDTSLLQRQIHDSDVRVRRAAVQWIGEEKHQEFRDSVVELLSQPGINPDVMLACLATLSLLDGVPASEFEKVPPAHYALAMLSDDQRPAALRATALRLIPPSMPELKGDLLAKLAQSPDRALQTEAVRTLQQSPRPEALPVLLKLADDANADVDVRADALSALSAIVPHEQPLPGDVEALLLRFAQGDIPFSDASQKLADLEPLRLVAIRSLRGRAVEGSTIRQVLEKNCESAGGNRVLRDAIDLALTGKSTFDPSDSQPSTLDPQPEAGRRVFFAHQGPLCAKCHTVHGRGGNIGPDLSTIARTMSRQKLVESILDPSREISPYFLTWSIATASGKVHTGLVITENGGGDVQLGDSQGNVIAIPRREIEERTPSKVSVMPQGLHQRMTAQEFADLIAYLETLR